MSSTIGTCKLFRIKHTNHLEGEPFLRNKTKIAFFAHFLVENKPPLLDCNLQYPFPVELLSIYRLSKRGGADLVAERVTRGIYIYSPAEK